MKTMPHNFGNSQSPYTYLQCHVTCTSRVT